MTFKEHNNRKKADKFAEYITGEELRRYTASKVHHYCGEDISVFDGAVGSGQLEQYIKAKSITGVEIQQEACDTFLSNYSNAKAFNQSFFNFQSDEIFDCIVMNPPFSLKFKSDLTDEERESITQDFGWKKSGVVDDIFILKSLKFTKRFAFYICFAGISYRSTELKMREIIGNQLLELNVIKNAFEDTNIDVLFLVIDKQKQSKELLSEIYDCKTKTVLLSQRDVVDVEKWQTPQIIIEKKPIDIVAVEKQIRLEMMKRRRAEIELDKLINLHFKNNNKQEKQLTIEALL